MEHGSEEVLVMGKGVEERPLTEEDSWGAVLMQEASRRTRAMIFSLKGLIERCYRGRLRA